MLAHWKMAFQNEYFQKDNKLERLFQIYTYPDYCDSIMVPEKWYLSSAAMVRVTLKEGKNFKQLSLESRVINTQLDFIAYGGTEDMLLGPYSRGIWRMYR